MNWYNAHIREPKRSDFMIVAVFDDGCTAMHLTYIDGQGWCEAEDATPVDLHGMAYWCHAPEKYHPWFMVRDFE